MVWLCVCVCVSVCAARRPVPAGVAMVLAIVGKVYAVVIKRASDFAMQKKKELIVGDATKAPWPPP